LKQKRAREYTPTKSFESEITHPKSKYDLLTASSKVHYFPKEKTKSPKKSHQEKERHDIEYSVAGKLPFQNNSNLAIENRIKESKSEKNIDKLETVQRQIQSFKTEHINTVKSLTSNAYSALSHTQPSAQVPVDVTTITPTVNTTPTPRVFQLGSHEAVPVTTTETPEVYHINYITGYNGQEFDSPRDAFDQLADAVFSDTVKNHKKRKIDVNDYKEVLVHENPPLVNANLLPTIYRSQIHFNQTTNKGNKSFESNIKQTAFENATKQNNKQTEEIDFTETETIKKTSNQDLSVGHEDKQPSVSQARKNISKFIEKHPEAFQFIPTVNQIEKVEQTKSAKFPQESEQTKNPNIKRKESLVSDSFKRKTEIKKVVDREEKNIYQRVFEITTRRPKYKIVRKVRIPKQFATSPPQTMSSSSTAREYKPVHDNEKVKLVYKEEGFVPEFVPRY